MASSRWRRAASTVADDGREVAFAGVAETLLGVEHVLRVKPSFDALGEFDLVGGVEQGGLANAIEIHAHQVSGWALGVQIAVDAACGGICHYGLLLGWNCHELQRRNGPKSSHAVAGFTPSDLQLLADDLRMS